MGDLARVVAGLTSIFGGARALRGVMRERRDRRREQLARAPQTGAGMTVTHHKVRSLDDRISFIKGQVKKGGRDPQVRAAATRILTKKCGNDWCVPEKDWRAEMVALFNVVRSNVRYTLDFADADLYQHPRRILETRAGDCDDYTILLASLLKSVGHRVKARVIETKQSVGGWDHIYLVVGLPPQRPTFWMPLDASVSKPAGWEAPAKMVRRRRDFDL